jgi:hypothetical protein
MNDWPSAVFGFVGVVVGAGATYLSQSQLWSRSTRRGLYGRFTGKCTVALDSLLEVRYAIDKKLPRANRNRCWKEANERLAEVFSLHAEVGLVGSRPTRDAGAGLVTSLRDVRSKLYDADKHELPPETASQFEQELQKSQDAFASAARKELRFPR